MPSTVRANAYFGKYHNIEVEDEVTVFLEYPNGATGVFTASTGEAPGSNRLEVAADRGKLIYENGIIFFSRTEKSVNNFCRTNPEKFAVPDCWSVTIPCTDNSSTQHKNIIENFVNSILTGETLYVPGREGINSLELVLCKA